MLRIISVLFLFLNPAYSHDLNSEYSEFKDQISYELMANNHKKNMAFFVYSWKYSYEASYLTRI